MATTTASIPSTTNQRGLWLRSRNWDLTWITLSVVLVALPYAVYLAFLAAEPSLAPLAERLGTTVNDLGRNFVNAFVAFLVGGPHMYVTWTRTWLDRDFSKKHTRFLVSSLTIPLIVITGAMLNLQLLLTVFFFWASIHVLHQIVYIVALYNGRQVAKQSRLSQAADYAVVLTALYPLAAWKIANNTFAVGQNNLSEVVGKFVPLGPWMVWLAGGAFGIALLAWLYFAIADWRKGTLNIPKTAFIGFTALASFIVPALGNLDTAFQGMNVWHSLQYLALTWMLNRVRYDRGDLKASPFVSKLSAPDSAKRYYGFFIGLTLADVALAGVILVILLGVTNLKFDAAFDRAYYIAVLSFLWVHYYHDHYLFAQVGKQAV
jgi:hypothetical protein